LSVTSFFYYFVVSFFGISKELIYVYSLVLLVIFFVLKKSDFKQIAKKITGFRLTSYPIKQQNLPELFVFFVLVLILSISVFFIPINKTINFDDSSYHLPIIQDIGNNGQKTFFVETHNIYQVRSNQFPLLFESFVGVTKFFLVGDFFWLVSFFALFLSLFLIYFISKEVGYGEFYSVALYGLTPFVVVFSRYFGTEAFLSMFFLGCVFFVLKYVRSQNLFFVVVAGFLAGLMFLVKFTGGVFFVGLLLFLLYKRKFKASVLFGLIFVLISLVFVVSHLTVPIEQNSVGGYGSLVSDNIVVQFPLNILTAFDRLFYYFSTNFYIFLIPLFFILGLFWIRKNENDFLLLLVFLLVLFLLVTFFNGTTPSKSGFPRYFMPIYSLLCIFSGFQIKKIFLINNKRVTIFFTVLFVSILLFTSMSFLQYFNSEYSSSKNRVFVGKGISNDYNVTVWFLNNAALTVNLSNATLYDYSWRADFSGKPCDFIKKHKINYVVYYAIDKDPDNLAGSPDFLGDFGLKLRNSLLNDECSELISKSDPLNNAATFKIIYK